MSVEDRLRRSMRDRAGRVETSPDAYDRIVEQAEAPHRPWVAPALAIGSAAAVVALVLAFVGGDDDPADEVVAGGPDPGVPVAAMPIWPVADFDGLDTMQRRVDAGEKPWLLEPREVAREYLAEHGVDVDTVRIRRDDIDPDLAAHADAAVAGYLGGWVELARAGAGDDAVWFVVGAHDSRLPVVDAVRSGARIEVEFPIVLDDLDVVIRVGRPDREWLTEKSVEVREDQPGRVAVDLDPEAPTPLILHLRTDAGDGFVGLTEMWVDRSG